MQSDRIKKLTKRVVDSALPSASRYIVWDADLAGFGLRVEPSGRKSFIARYRAGGGRSGKLRQQTIGRLGALTADEARSLAKKTLGAAAAGRDPVGERRAARQRGITVGEICDWYLEEAEGGRLLGRKGRPIKASTLATDRIRINAHVRPLLGKKTAQALRVADFERMQADIAEHKTAAKLGAHGRRKRGGIPKGGTGTAGRTLGMLRTILEHAVRRGLIASNPARGARKVADKKRNARLSLEQIGVLGAAMQDAATEGENLTGLAAVRVILLTGFRRGEALGLRREWLMDTGGIDFPDTKSGPQVRPVGRSAMEAIAACFVDNHQQWAFPAERGNGHFIGLSKVLGRVCSKAKLNKVTPHVLRHTFASIAAELGFSELTIAGLLGHSGGSVTATYVHLDSALVAAANEVSARISSALAGKTETDQIKGSVAGHQPIVRY